MTSRNVARATRPLAVVLALVAVPVATAGIVWFDPTQSGAQFDTFGALTDAYRGFVGAPAQTIDFNDLADNTQLSDQYAARGVTFSNTAGGPYNGYSGAWAEGSGIVQDVTGYDGSYMPNGDRVYVKFSNNVPGTPFTMTFATPTNLVGAFVGMGVEGDIHSLSLTAYDADNHVLGSQTINSWLWESDPSNQNYESFFALRTDQPLISRVEIINNATTDFANALILDNVSFSGGADSGGGTVAPEPATFVTLALGCAALWPYRRRTAF